MIHDFICCESVSNPNSSAVLTTADIVPPANALMIGKFFISILAKDYFEINSIEKQNLNCKYGMTLLDLLSIEGGSSVSTSFHINSDNESYGWPHVVLMESLVINCNRCGSYIGDAMLTDDCCDPNQTQSNSNEYRSTHKPINKVNKITNSGKIDPNDIRDIRFSLNCITISNKNHSIQCISLEQVYNYSHSFYFI